MQTTQDFAGSTDMWSTSVGGHLDRFHCTFKNHLLKSILYKKQVFFMNCNNVGNVDKTRM